jgi:hypothetical protein
LVIEQDNEVGEPFMISVCVAVPAVANALLQLMVVKVPPSVTACCTAVTLELTLPKMPKKLPLFAFEVPLLKSNW